MYERSAEGGDLVEKMLRLDPMKRITLQEALEHPFMSQYSMNRAIPKMNPISPLEFEFEETAQEMAREHLKGKMVGYGRYDI